MTLRVRFALWVAGLLVIVMTVFGGLVYSSLARGLYASIDDSLRLSAAQALTTVNSEDGRVEISNGGSDVTRVGLDLSDRGLTVRVFDLQGNLVDAFGPYTSIPLQPSDLSSARLKQSRFTTLTKAEDSETLRFYTVPIVENGQVTGVLQVVESLNDVVETLARLRTALFIGAPFVALVAALGGYVLATKALAPIDVITRTAEQISSQDLSARLDLAATHDEVGRLAATFDRMLARLDASFRRERRFVADASHELRTPLAAMQAILSVMREGRRTVEEYEQTLADLTEETNRLRALVEDLLTLARSDRQKTLVQERVELTSMSGSVTQALRPLAENKGLTLSSRIDPDLVVRGDEDALIRVFVNLLDNAVKYTNHGGITVVAHHHGALTLVAISETRALDPGSSIFPTFSADFTVLTPPVPAMGSAWAWPLRKTLFRLTGAPSRSTVNREPAPSSPSVSPQHEGFFTIVSCSLHLAPLV